MATDYSKKTNADLVEILKSRSLPHTGKKAELVARLQESDSQSGAAPAPSSAAKADTTDDVIDWEDDEVPAEGTKPSTEPGAAALAAGGKGQVSNPAAVPNQQLGDNPAATSDLKVESTGEEAGKEGSEAVPAAATAEGGADAQEEEKPAPNFAKGLPTTEMEEELRKRKARAEKFGITEDSQTAIAEAEKSLERAKRFGTGADPNAGVGVRKLDEALPQEKSRKRGRNDQGGRGGKRRNFGGRNQGRRQGGGNRNRREGGNNSTNGTSGQSSRSEQDRAAMEARKQRFGA